MFKKLGIMFKKLKSKSGETLVEALVSIMIASLAIGLLYSTIMACYKILEQSADADAKYYEELGIAETYQGESQEIQITITFEGELPVTITVDQYGGTDGTFASYYYEYGEGD